MKQENIYKIAPIFISVFVFCFAVVFYALGWTEPTVAPPGGNVDVPINVGSTGQSKAGGLVLNTGGAVNGLIVQNGKVGIGTANPSQKLDVIGQIHATQDICTDAGGGKCLSTGGAAGGIPCDWTGWMGAMTFTVHEGSKYGNTYWTTIFNCQGGVIVEAKYLKCYDAKVAPYNVTIDCTE